jgi:hypothetical protein
VTATTAAIHENERKRGGGGGQEEGGGRAGALPKKLKGGVCQVTSEREDIGGVAGGATGGKGEAEQKGRGKGTNAPSETERTRGKTCSVKKEAKEFSPCHPVRVKWPTACVRWAMGGRAPDYQPPPFKKEGRGRHLQLATD